MAVGVEVNLVGSTWRVDIDPRLMLVDKVRQEVQGISDTLAHLSDPEVYIPELVQVLENIGTLPPFYIGLFYADRVPFFHLIDQVQHLGVEAYPVVEQGGPDQAGEERLTDDLQGIFPFVV